MVSLIAAVSEHATVKQATTHRARLEQHYCDPVLLFVQFVAMWLDSIVAAVLILLIGASMRLTV